MKQSEILELTTEEVKERLEEERTGLHKMRMNHYVSDLDNPKQLTYKRRTIARLMTELRKREMEANKEG